MQRIDCRLKLQQKAFLLQLILKRTKIKVKKQKNRSSPVSVTERVLEYFDLYYTPTYKSLWPSLRISLLSAKKPAAVINNFAIENKHPKNLFERGAYNVIQSAAVRQKALFDKHKVTSENADTTRKIDNQDVIDSYELDTGISAVDTDTYSGLKTSFTQSENYRKDLDVFVSEKSLYYYDTDVYNEDEEELSAMNEGEESDSDNIEDSDKHSRVEFTALNNKVDIVKPKPLSIPENLRLLTFPLGDISNFPAVKGDRDGRLYFYMLDGSSVLPVIALDLENGDSVLDLCAAPGGKSISMLQTGLPAKLHCNDVSQSRMFKLKTFLNYCVPSNNQTHMEFTTTDGREFVTPEFNKVLVDVPCNTDRHFVLTDENNLFSRNRANERLELPKIQKDLLVSAIKACLPGGNIVYSTCTLAPGQNDGTVQMALDEILQTTDIEVVVEDLQEMVDLFKDTFKFYPECRFGKLVIPSLLSNFGPMYICRLKRIS